MTATTEGFPEVEIAVPVARLAFGDDERIRGAARDDVVC